MKKKEIIDRVTTWLKEHMKDYALLNVNIEVDESKAEVSGTAVGEIVNKETLDLCVKIDGDNNG